MWYHMINNNWKLPTSKRNLNKQEKNAIYYALFIFNKIAKLCKTVDTPHIFKHTLKSPISLCEK